MNTFSSVEKSPGYYNRASVVLRKKHGLHLNTHVCPLVPYCKNNNSQIYKIERGVSKNGRGLFARALYDADKDKFQFLYCGSFMRPHVKGHRKCLDWFKKPREDLFLPSFEKLSQQNTTHFRPGNVHPDDRGPTPAVSPAIVAGRVSDADYSVGAVHT